MNNNSIRLLRPLEAALRTLGDLDWKKAGFFMGTWATKVPVTPLLGCGTTCCAYGVGTALPSWKEAGLGLTGRRSNFELPVPYARYTLGLTQREWEYLFLPTEYYDPSPEDTLPMGFASMSSVSPTMVADRINFMLEDFENMTRANAIDK